MAIIEFALLPQFLNRHFVYLSLYLFRVVWLGGRIDWKEKALPHNTKYRDAPALCSMGMYDISKGKRNL